jgi:hypothetical protein
MVRAAAIVAAITVLFGSTPAWGGVREDAAAARRGLAKAVAQGRLQAGSAQRYRAILTRTTAAAPRLPAARGANLRGALRSVAAQSARYTEARALALFVMLETNTSYFSTRDAPRARNTDIEDADGVVYRFFAGHGFQFHPLANFARLNAHGARNDLDRAARMGAALLARTVPVTGGGRVWEYYFPFGGGRPPWTSGMAQAVAAQALVRAGTKLGDSTLLDAATHAYRSLPGRLVQSVAAGPWIKLYSFTRLTVLNAHLQSILSLSEYGELRGDPDAQRLATRFEASARAMLPRFDTGYWSLYALRGNESSLAYHEYVISLARRLATRTGAPEWWNIVDRFEGYMVELPVLTLKPFPTILYPQPREGFRDDARIPFSLSKISTVTLEVGGERQTLVLGRGPHTLVWRPGRRPPGRYAPSLTAVDLAGNPSEVRGPVLEVRRDTTPPDLTASLEGRRVAWDAIDEATPWLRLRVRLQRGAKRKIVDFGRRALSGSAPIAVRGPWTVTLIAADSAGNVATAPLGTIGG